MDKLSLKVLKYIFSEDDAVSRETVLASFGQSAMRSLSFPEEQGYIKSGRFPVGVGMNHVPILRSDGMFCITSKGVAFLEKKPGMDFDHWLTRIAAIWGAITGTIAVIAEILLHSR